MPHRVHLSDGQTVELLTADDVAERLGINPQTARHMLRQGDIDARKWGARWLVSPAALDRYIEDSLL